MSNIEKMDLFDVPITVSNPMLSFKNKKTRIVKEYVYVKCDCKRGKIYEVTIMDLSREIMVEILSRLPIKPIFRCKTICKRWYNLLTSDPLFVNIYQTRSCNFPCILFSDDESVASILELKADYDYFSRPLNRPIMLSPEFHLPRGRDRYGFSYDREELGLVGSCNGFICLRSGDKYSYEKHSIYISNPLLGEYFKVKLPEWEKRVRRVAYGFCYNEGSRQYKVLRSVIRKFWRHPQVTEMEICTLGVDDKWKNVGEAPFPLYGRFGNVNVNGVVYWLKDDDDIKTKATIHSFNIGTEEVMPVPVPPGLETPCLGLTLVELGNCLCLIDNCFSQHVDIWRMKECGIAESWTKDCILTDSIPRDVYSNELIPIVLWKDGEILMQSKLYMQLVSYNPKEKKFKKVNVYDCGYAATRYFPSFYSLKTVMGESFQISNAYPKTEIV